MSDDVDRAQEREEEMRQDALAERSRASQQLSAGDSAEFCEDCGDAIPEARRQAFHGCTRCVECQGFAEERARRGMR